jgi:hypothetical protein
MDNGGTRNTGDAAGKHRIKAYYRDEHGHDPAILSTAEDVDALIEALRTGPPGYDMADLFPLSRPLLSDGVPDRQLRVGIKGDLGVGAISFMDVETGILASLGPPGSRKGVFYDLMGHRSEFPDHSEVPIYLVRRALKEFLASGGERPTCIQWQEDI